MAAANTKEKDPVEVQAKVEAVCATYREASRLYAEEHTHTVCTDEMTGIQALERIAKTLPEGPGHRECRAIEYVRHGTLALIGNFHVVTGELVAPSLGLTRMELDNVAELRTSI